VSYPVHDRILAIQRSCVMMLLNPDTLERVEDQALKVGGKDQALDLPELFGTLSAAIFAEWRGPAAGEKVETSTNGGKQGISSLRRNLQRSYLGDLIRIAVQGRSMGPQITRALAWTELRGLKAGLDVALREGSRERWDASTLAHMEESRARIEKALAASYKAE